MTAEAVKIIARAIRDKTTEDFEACEGEEIDCISERIHMSWSRDGVIGAVAGGVELLAETAVDALSSAGLLLTPQISEVLEAARRLRRTDRRVDQLEHGAPAEEGHARWIEYTDACEAFDRAVDTYEAGQREGGDDGQV